MGWKVWGLNPSWAKGFLISPQCPDWLQGPPCLIFNWHWGSFPGVNQPRCAVNWSPPCCAEVNNEWSYTCTSPVCLHGVDTETFTLTVSSDLFDITASLLEHTKEECRDLW